MKTKFCFLVIFIFCSCHVLTAQDILYKKNGEVIEVQNLSPSGKSRSYTLPGDAEGVIRYISTNIIDSILYANGTKDKFQTSAHRPVSIEFEKKPFNRNYIGIDLGAISFYQNLKFSYEYLFGDGTVGLFAAFSKNLEPYNVIINESPDYEINPDYYSSLMRHLGWNGRFGINAYIFKPGFFRISGGLYLLTGKYTKETYRYIDREPWTIITKYPNNSMSGLLFSPAFIWQPDDFYQIRAGLDIPLYAEPKFYRTTVKVEAMLNF
jgi:hypothetical protein